MKIRLAVLEKDSVYLERFVNVFQNRYQDKVEIYSFTEEEKAISNLESLKIDVFIVSEEFRINTKNIPSKCTLAYMVESDAIETMYGQLTICKYHKAELIYKQILGLYSEIASSDISLKVDSNSSGEIITFVSGSGGVGSSTMATACAINLSNLGKRVLYLNLEHRGYINQYFNQEGQYGISEIIYALKSKRSNLALKLESTVKRDACGVFFFDTPRNVMDVIELKSEDISRLLTELCIIAAYDYIVLDINFDFSTVCIEILKKSSKIIFVSNGTEVANYKFEQAMKGLEVIEQQQNIRILSRILLMYNAFSNKTSSMITNPSFRVIGGVPKFEGAPFKAVVDQVVTMNIFSCLL